MARDLLLGKTSRCWGRAEGSRAEGSRAEGSRDLEAASCGAIPEGATGYAPTTWWTKDQAEKKVQELMKSGGIFGMSLPRDLAEQSAMEYFRKHTIGIMS